MGEGCIAGGGGGRLGEVDSTLLGEEDLIGEIGR